MTTAQLLFSVALGLITLVILAFAAYVISSARWGDRWVSGQRSDSSRTEEK